MEILFFICLRYEGVDIRWIGEIKIRLLLLLLLLLPRGDQSVRRIVVQVADDAITIRVDWCVGSADAAADDVVNVQPNRRRRLRRCRRR